jgi:hypothetical protein
MIMGYFGAGGLELITDGDLSLSCMLEAGIGSMKCMYLGSSRWSFGACGRSLFSVSFSTIRSTRGVAETVGLSLGTYDLVRTFCRPHTRAYETNGRIKAGVDTGAHVKAVHGLFQAPW